MIRRSKPSSLMFSSSCFSLKREGCWCRDTNRDNMPNESYSIELSLLNKWHWSKTLRSYWSKSQGWPSFTGPRGCAHVCSDNRQLFPTLRPIDDGGKIVSFSSSLASSNRSSLAASSTVEKSILIWNSQQGRRPKGVVIGFGNSGGAIQLLEIHVHGLDR